MYNFIVVDGNKVNIGRTPDALPHCGFKDREEVRRVAAKFSAGEPLMKLDDVAAYFRNH